MTEVSNQREAGEVSRAQVAQHHLPLYLTGRSMDFILSVTRS